MPETQATDSARSTPPRRPLDRSRGRSRVRGAIARRILELRHDARRYRRLSAVLAAVAVVSLIAAGATVAADTEREPTPLGTGVAGVEPIGEVDPGGPSSQDLVEVPADAVPPPPDERAGRKLGEGSASYYHDSLEGRSTASGEAYRGGSLTAAHRSLPFGSKLRVTNLRNDRSVVVRVNDRGPYAHGRVLDLSRSAAAEIGLLARGHGRVRLELLE